MPKDELQTATVFGASRGERQIPLGVGDLLGGRFLLREVLQELTPDLLPTILVEEVPEG
jgi:hypothetical protein